MYVFSGRPVFVLYLGIDLLSVVPFSVLSLSFSSYFVLKERAVLSLNFGNFLLNRLTAAAGPCSEAYFPIS